MVERSCESVQNAASHCQMRHPGTLRERTRGALLRKSSAREREKSIAQKEWSSNTTKKMKQREGGEEGKKKKNNKKRGAEREQHKQDTGFNTDP